MDAMKQIFEKKRKAIKDEIRQVEEGTHPGLIVQLDAIEEKHDRWVNRDLPLMRELMEKDAESRYRAAVEAAKKAYSDSCEQMKDAMMKQLKEEREEIEEDYLYDTLESSTSRRVPRRKRLRSSPCEEVELKGPRKVQALNISLPKKEIQKHLSALRKIVAKFHKNKAVQETSRPTPQATVVTGDLGERTADTSVDSGDENAATTGAKGLSPGPIYSSLHSHGGVMSKMKSESEERPSPSHGDSLLPKTYQIGKKVLIFGPRGLLRATISKIGPTRVDVITEGGNRLVSIGKHEIENRTYIFDPPGVIRLLRKYKVESEVVGEISSAPEVDVANSADFGDESVAATGAPE